MLYISGRAKQAKPKFSVALLAILVAVILMILVTSSYASMSSGGNHTTRASSVASAATPKPGKPIQDLKLDTPQAPDVVSHELGNYYFYIDPGHSPVNNTCVSLEDPNGRGTGPHWGAYEGDINLQIALDLRGILIDHGANPLRVIMSRSDPNKGVSVEQRTEGTALGQPGDCNTYGNNQAFIDNGRPANNWRFISIHQNCCVTNYASENEQVYRRKDITLTIPLADTFAENIMWQENRPYAHGAAPFWGNVPQPYELYVIEHSMPWQNNQNGASFNILTETGFLSEYNYNQWIQQSANQQALAQSLYRGMVDFFLVGKEGSINTKHQEVIDRYRSSIGAGYDPGVPFNNGGGYLVHQWGNAYTQEFSGTLSIQGLGSILKPLGGGLAYYVRDPIWSTYVQKGGPNSNGPGLPLGDEHPFSTVRRANGRTYSYPKTMNFERGAIVWNSYEGGMSTSYDQHALFLANCNASGINDPTFGTDLQGMVRRFALSTDLDTSQLDPNLPERYPGGYTDADLHVNAWANRAEIAQALVWSESFNDYTGTAQLYDDIQGHWARPLIRIAADRQIAIGYTTNPPCDAGNPCWKPNAYVTRGQFAKMESVARGWALSNPMPDRSSVTCPAEPPFISGYHSFSDVCYGDTFYQHIETVKAHNAIVGYSTRGPCTDDFPPPCYMVGNSVTRGQMSKVINESLITDGVPPPFGCWFRDFPSP